MGGSTTTIRWFRGVSGLVIAGALVISACSSDDDAAKPSTTSTTTRPGIDARFCDDLVDADEVLGDLDTTAAGAAELTSRLRSDAPAELEAPLGVLEAAYREVPGTAFVTSEESVAVLTRPDVQAAFNALEVYREADCGRDESPGEVAPEDVIDHLRQTVPQVADRVASVERIGGTGAGSEWQVNTQNVTDSTQATIVCTEVARFLRQNGVDAPIDVDRVEDDVVIARREVGGDCETV